MAAPRTGFRASGRMRLGASRLSPDRSNALRPRVLLVDDSPMVGRAIASLLQRYPSVYFSFCEDPLRAVDEAIRMHPTVVLLDWLMPEADGLSVLHALRARPEFALLPIVILSSQDQIEAKVRAFAAGATDYLIKLPAESELIARIEHHTRVFLHQDEVHRTLRENQRVLEEKNRHLERLAAELREAHEQAVAASDAKSNFLANVSHEIRTPMNAILGLTRLCLETTLTDVQRGYLQHVDGAATSLLRILNDILDLSKIEAGQLDFQPRVFSLRELLDEVVQSLSSQASEKGLTLGCVVQPEVPDRVMTDSLRLQQVLVHLVGNALKFTERGSVVIEIAPGPLQGDRHELHFTVCDTGVGIPDDKLAVIFEAFTQADNSLTRLHGGTGLGLTISSSLVAMMGGQIWVTSEVGQGTTFHFSVMSEPPPEAPSLSEVASVVNRPPDRPLRILLAEDNPLNRLVAIAFLEEVQADVVVAEDGEQAVERALAGRFDLILMDVQMPKMDGLAATRELRRQGVETPIVALTAHALNGAAELCLETGMNAYVSKPLEAEKLFAAIAQVCAPARPLVG